MGGFDHDNLPPLCSHADSYFRQKLFLGMSPFVRLAQRSVPRSIWPTDGKTLCRGIV